MGTWWTLGLELGEHNQDITEGQPVMEMLNLDGHFERLA